jgi:hypothetical protein
VPRVTRYRQQRSENLPLGIHLLMFGVVVGCFCMWFYELMQPERYSNPGTAASKPPPATVILYPPWPRLKDEIDATVAADTLIEPEQEATNKRAPTELKSSRESKTLTQKRRHAALPRRSRNPMTDFAAQPFFFGHPWRSWR